MSLIVGLAVIYAVEDLVPSLRDRLQLKWSNDVFLEGRKLAGILCEGTTDSNCDFFASQTLRERTNLVVGIGFNHRADFSQVDKSNLISYPIPSPISLSEVTGDIPSELALLERIRHYLLEAAGMLEFSTRSGNYLLAKFLPAIERRDLLRDREISLDLPTAKVTGTAAGINERGELLLRLPDGRIQPFSSGKVVWKEGKSGESK
jgi:BirA family biotin operon repressor/biotin-[acetyl-CoA-carboxylase] ligase